VSDLNKANIEKKVQSDTISSLLTQVGLVITILFLLAALGSYVGVVNKKEATIQRQQQQMVAIQQQQAQEMAHFNQKLAALKQQYENKLAREQQQKKQLAAEAETHIRSINEMIRQQMQQVEKAAADRQKEIEALSHHSG